MAAEAAEVCRKRLCAVPDRVRAHVHAEHVEEHHPERDPEQPAVVDGLGAAASSSRRQCERQERGQAATAAAADQEAEKKAGQQRDGSCRRRHCAGASGEREAAAAVRGHGAGRARAGAGGASRRCRRRDEVHLLRGHRRDLHDHGENLHPPPVDAGPGDRAAGEGADQVGRASQGEVRDRRGGLGLDLGPVQGRATRHDHPAPSQRQLRADLRDERQVDAAGERLGGVLQSVESARRLVQGHRRDLEPARVPHLPHLLLDALQQGCRLDEGNAPALSRTQETSFHLARMEGPQCHRTL
mmetsp:Transcript_43148/g.101859  ORF Transcript_43148/g.101859 Transcript_43148/m.101859 type:complete len:299 (+) Transcript_43148:631-1527(+)